MLSMFGGRWCEVRWMGDTGRCDELALIGGRVGELVAI